MLLAIQTRQLGSVACALIFFRGGGAHFPKIFENFADIFYRSINLIFRALREYYKDLIVTKILSASGNIFKKQAKRSF